MVIQLEITIGIGSVGLYVLSVSAGPARVDEFLVGRRDLPAQSFS